MSVIFSKLKNVTYKPLLRKIEVVSSLMCFLIRVLDSTRPMLDKKGKVIEHNMLFAYTTIQSEEFKQDPTVLDKLKIPADYCRLWVLIRWAWMFIYDLGLFSLTWALWLTSICRSRTARLDDVAMVETSLSLKTAPSWTRTGTC